MKYPFPPSKCTNCNGTGLEPDPAYPHEECSVCEGTGMYTPPSFFSNRMEVVDGEAISNPAIEPNDMRFDPKWQELNKSSSVAFSLAWNILKASTERKKLSLNRRPNTGPISFTNERQKTREQRMIQDMINATGNEQPRDVMNQKGREQNPQEEENQYQQMLEDFQNQKELEKLVGHSLQEGTLDFKNYPVTSSKAVESYMEG
tara:strand:+ start:1038 stop:1646 length:609 start_codon:yes stop_codon:yes gene_type:complete